MLWVKLPELCKWQQLLDHSEDRPDVHKVPIHWLLVVTLFIMLVDSSTLAIIRGLFRRSMKVRMLFNHSKPTSPYP
jgi:hypothetical protein